MKPFWIPVHDFDAVRVIVKQCIRERNTWLWQYLDEALGNQDFNMRYIQHTEGTTWFSDKLYDQWRRVLDLKESEK